MDAIKNLRHLATNVRREGSAMGMLIDATANAVCRDYLPIPKDRDGDIIEIGSTLYGGDGQAWHIIGFKPGKKYDVIGQKPTGEINSHLRGCWLSKGDPTSMAMSADGKVLEPGMTVWVTLEHISDCGKDTYNLRYKAGLYGYRYGDAVEVREVVSAEKVLLDTEHDAWCPASWLTTEEPDTQARIDADKMKDAYDYWGCSGVSCSRCPAKDDGKDPKERYGFDSCSKAQGMDIALRQAELDAAMRGEQR